MKVGLAGAFGNLGFEIFKNLIANNYDVVALDIREKDNEFSGKYIYKHIDVTREETLTGVFDDCDIVISTVGLTTSSNKFSCYDIDFQGNVNLYEEAKKSNVKKFIYISVIACDTKDAKKVPMLNSKRMFETVLQNGEIPYLIYRPTGYFYDIIKVFTPYIKKGQMQLLKGYGDVKANVVDCSDFAIHIVNNLDEENKIYEIGGKETYSYNEITKLCFKASNKPVNIKYVPKFMFSILANLPIIKKSGKRDVILFSKFSLSHNLVGKDIIGDKSFKEYIEKNFRGE